MFHIIFNYYINSIYLSRYMQNLDQDKEKILTNQEIQEITIIHKEIKSQFHRLYKEKLSPIQINHCKIQQHFTKAEISYNPNGIYQKFQFSVEKNIPSFNHYQINVKIAHFNLTLTALKQKSSHLITVQQNFRGVYGQIYFVNYGNQEICIKSIPYKSETNFQDMFAMTVKELSILKICSVLECAPFIDNYFGFDILIYNDCIQYAMEKGRPIHEIDPLYLNQLNAVLRLMHEFHIVHLDIKPENVVWSERYCKAVFIDFGFSEIVKEEIGMKTFSIFKGTPNFASTEMLALMVQVSGYIDLYYNDVQCLGLVLKMANYKQRVNNYNSNAERQQEIDSISQHKNTYVNYLLYAFTYHYLDNNEQKCRYFLKLCLAQDKNSIKQIFKLIKQVLAFVFLPDFFKHDLQSFKELIQYKQIKNCLKQNGEIYSFKFQIYQHAVINNEELTQQIEPLSVFCETSLQTLNFPHYKVLLLDLTIFQEKLINNYMALAFQCIRFDVKNFDLQEKQLIAKKIRQLLKQYQKNGNRFLKLDSYEFNSSQQSKLSTIKLFFAQLLVFCLHSKMDKWIKNNIFNIFEQMIIVGTDYFRYFDDFYRYTQSNFQSYQDRTLCILLHTRLLHTIENLQEQSHEQALYIKLYDIIMKEHARLMMEPLEQSDIECIAIQRILKALYAYKLIQPSYRFDDRTDDLKHIKNNKVRKYLLFHITMQKIQYVFDSVHSEEALKITQFIKRSLQLRTLDLMSFSRIHLKLTNATFNYAEQFAFCNHLAQIINCSEIYNRIKFIVVSQKQDFISYTVCDTLQKIKKYYEGLQRVSIDNDYSLYKLIFFLNNKQIKMDSPQIIASLKQIYKLYEKTHFKRQKFKDCNKVLDYHKIYAAIQIEYFFYQLSDETKKIFLQHFYQTMDEEIIIQKDNRQEKSYQFIFNIFQVYTYKYFAYLYKKEWKPCLQALNMQIELFKQLNISEFIIEALKNMTLVSINTKIEQLIVKNVFKLYNYCKQINFFSFYFHPQNMVVSVSTLVVLVRHNKPIFYEFLGLITIFLTNHPINYYIQVLIMILERFLKDDPTHSYVMHYKRLSNSPFIEIKGNPYMLICYIYSLYNDDTQSRSKLFKIIALNCDLLNEFAKRFLLQKYFTVFLRFIDEKALHHRLLTFRIGKRYLSEEKLRKQAKQLFIYSHRLHKDSTVFHTKMKKKVEQIIMNAAKII